MMSGYIQLSDGSTNVEELQKTMKTLAHLTARGVNIVKGLLDFSRRDEVQQPVFASIKNIIQETVLMLKQTLSHSSVRIVVDVADVPQMTCYPGQIAQVIVNLIKNAIDAMGNTARKELYITGRMCSCHERACEKPCEHDGCIVLRVADTGKGIAKHIVDRIFEPFMTTKGVVGGGDRTVPGTGLGLSVSYGIIMRHNGTIRVESVEGKGTVVVITLPLARSDV
jgi:signal transduction histidine kinase